LAYKKKSPSFQFFILKPMMRLARWYQNRLAQQNINALIKFRGIADWIAERTMSIPPGVELIETQIGNIPGTWFVPENAPESPLLLFLHGGSNVFTWGKPHRKMISYLALYSGLQVVGIDFSLAPQYPYPAAHDECFKAYQSLVESGKQIVLIGESSGGVLVLSTMLRARNASLPLPILGAFISPLTDLIDPDIWQYHDPFVHPEFVKKLTEIYLSGKTPTLIDSSPLTLDLHGLPPVYILVGESEILRPEAEKLAQKAELDGLDIIIKLWPAVWHGWHILIPLLPEAKIAINEIGADIVEYLRSID
jgi:acetyl esterase/lipase